MEKIISRVHQLLIKNKKTVAVAESCTGGLVSYLLTQLSGSSKYFILGLVTYSNQAKSKNLKIPHLLISRYGAVSKTLASKMAQGARKIGASDIGMGITGIAGPSGATPGKPSGTVFIAIDNGKRKICKKFKFSGSRFCVRKKAALKALELLKSLL